MQTVGNRLQILSITKHRNTFYPYHPPFAPILCKQGWVTSNRGFFHQPCRPRFIQCFHESCLPSLNVCPHFHDYLSNYIFWSQFVLLTQFGYYVNDNRTGASTRADCKRLTIEGDTGSATGQSGLKKGYTYLNAWTERRR